MLKKRKIPNDFELSSQLYFNDIAKFSSLSLDEELSLWKQYKLNNDISARDKLIKSNLKFVVNVAKSYQGLGLSYSDLIAEGNYGLMKAFEKFDYEKGYKTISYSVWWIKQAILEALKERSNIKGEDLPNDFEHQIENDDESIQNTCVSNNFIDEDKSELEQKLIEQKNLISLLMEDLTKRERNILIKYYGLENNDAMTLEEIGEEINLTKERVRQILVKIFKKMRSKAIESNISSYNV